MKKTGTSLPEKTLIPKGIFWFGLLVLCIASRMLSTIYYIEDPDSLRFALSVLEYDVANLQPHFPAYPVFCFVAKGFYLLFGKFSLAFSMIGALSTFFIIYFSYRSLNLLRPDSGPFIPAFLFFLNPLFWLMSNRFMPDLMGLAIVCMIWFLFFNREFSENDKSKFDKNGICIFLAAGILFGTRLSYIPAILIPLLWIFFKTSWKSRAQMSFAFLGAIFIWLIPLIADTGLAELIASASRHTSGHFVEFGGTVTTNPDWLLRAGSFFKHLWADGLGGFMPGRHIISLGFSLFILGALITGLFQAFRNQKSKSLNFILLISVLVYSFWIFFYQNIIYKSRHLLPLIPVILAIISIGLQHWKNRIGKWSLLLIIAGLGLNSALTFKLVSQHKLPSAVAQLKNFLGKKTENIDLLIAPDLIIYYLKKQDIIIPFHDINNPPEDLNSKLASGDRIFVIANLSVYRNLELRPVQNFQHNPYINRMWSTLVLSEIIPPENLKDE